MADSLHPTVAEIQKLVESILSKQPRLAPVIVDFLRGLQSGELAVVTEHNQGHSTLFRRSRGGDTKSEVLTLKDLVLQLRAEHGQ